MSGFKSSFPPISDDNTEILILGTLPGDRSLLTGEYFAHPRNRFWKNIAAITKNELPKTYCEKLRLLQQNKIGVWNVLEKAERIGSLDTAIKNEVPNDLPTYFNQHSRLRVIAFDGLKAEALYNKYFTRNSDLTYFSLPSCSPANARFTLEALCEIWAKIIQ